MNRPAGSVTSIDSDDVYTPEDLAQYWDVSPGTVRRLCRVGKLRGFTVGSMWRVTGRAVLEYQGEGAA